MNELNQYLPAENFILMHCRGLDKDNPLLFSAMVSAMKEYGSRCVLQYIDETKEDVRNIDCDDIDFLKQLRKYFQENDMSIFEQQSWFVINKLIKMFENNIEDDSASIGKIGGVCDKYSDEYANMLYGKDKEKGLLTTELIEWKKVKEAFMNGWLAYSVEAIEMIGLLREYSEFEAMLIEDNAMWWPHAPKDRISGKTYDKMMELQEKRNKLLNQQI